MIPKIELDSDKQTFTRKEVEEMLSSLHQACAATLVLQVKLYKFARVISYLSLSVALLLILKEMFL